MTTLSRSSHFAPPAAVLRGGIEAFNCYIPFSIGVEDSVLSQCEMAAIIHYLAVG